MNIDADTNRDGAVLNEPQAQEEVFNNTYGAIVLVNSDDDDDDSGLDWTDTQIKMDEDERELAELKVSQLNLCDTTGVTAELTIDASPDEAALMALDAADPNDRIRIYYRVKDPAATNPNRYVAVLGRGTGNTSWNIPVSTHPTIPDVGGCGNGTITLYVEGCDYGSDVFVTLTVRRGGAVLGTDRVRLMCAPYIMLSNVRNTYKVFVNDIFGGALKQRLTAVFPTKTERYSSTDRWVQDEFEFGVASWPPKTGSYQVMDCGVDLPRERGVHVYGIGDLTGPVPDTNHRHGGWVEAGTDTRSPQYGGNVEVSPPLPSTPYLLGKIVIGWPPMSDEGVRRFFKRQRIQARAAGGSWELVELDASWLAVGHIDEFVNFVPGTSGSKGFRMVLADPARAQAILGAAPANAGDIRNYSTFFYGTPDAYEEAGQTSAASGASTLIDNTKNFKDLIKPRTDGGRAYKWVRIFDSGNAGAIGQVALIDVAATNAVGNPADTLVISQAWLVRNSEDVRIALEGTAPVVAGGVWDVNPPAGSRYVLVEESKIWLARDNSEFPAIITSREVREDTDLWTKNLTLGAGGAASIARKITAAETVLRDATNGLGVAAADFIRVPGMYMARAAGGTITARTAEAYVPGMVNLCPVDGRMIVARPFGPRWPWPNAGDPVRDIFLYDARVTQQLHNPGDGRTADDADFVDDWDEYHRQKGEVHCGTNYRREPGPAESQWWSRWKDPS